MYTFLNIFEGTKSSAKLFARDENPETEIDLKFGSGKFGGGVVSWMVSDELMRRTALYLFKSGDDGVQPKAEWNWENNRSMVQINIINWSFLFLYRLSNCIK